MMLWSVAQLDFILTLTLYLKL